MVNEDRTYFAIGCINKTPVLVMSCIWHIHMSPLLQVVVNEEVDPSLVIKRLKQEIRDLKDEIRSWLNLSMTHTYMMILYTLHCLLVCSLYTAGSVPCASVNLC